MKKANKTSRKAAKAQASKRAFMEEINAVMKRLYSEIDRTMIKLGLWYEEDRSAADIVYDAVHGSPDELPFLTKEGVDAMFDQYVRPSRDAVETLKKRLAAAVSDMKDAEEAAGALRARLQALGERCE